MSKAAYCNLKAFMIVLILFATSCNYKKTEPNNFHLLNPEALQTGDVILRRGNGIVSSYIANNYGGDMMWSHCGIILMDSLVPMVIHSISEHFSESGGIHTESLEKYLKKAIPGSITVLRLKHLTPDKDLRLIAFLNRKQQERPPFDMQFDINDTTALFCTELVQNAFKYTCNQDSNQKKFEIKSRSFAIFYDTSLFQLIFSQKAIN
ncbi:MAG: YiiX/YebB-like N1pC/P60 family cysteine hydrolase [Bacteroidales bacterium]|nr:YiiX/YebB-like N1pC/P60 family cysteine hydrolase [Bacteroidales bacterium]